MKNEFNQTNRADHIDKNDSVPISMSRCKEPPNVILEETIPEFLSSYYQKHSNIYGDQMKILPC